MSEPLDVIVVGAGAAGVGIGVALRHLGVERFVLLERHKVGASFRRWPAEMRFITPSFPGNAFGLIDLNAVTHDTSPAFSLGVEHPTGREYARYLQAVARHFALPVQTDTDVTAVEPLTAGFHVTTSQGDMRARVVVWAAGEFQYPHRPGFTGAERCKHTSQIRSWANLKGAQHLIIGGYESGIDAATTLAGMGRQVHVLDPGAPWETTSPDPSRALSPYTRERASSALATGRLTLTGGATVECVTRVHHGWLARSTDGRDWFSPTPPLLATGFSGSLDLVTDLFDWEGGHARLTSHDESTRASGLFLAGPAVRHGAHIFCFIYKFRQRFAVVAAAIADQLGLDPTPLETYRARGMWLDDLSCCGDRCAC